MSNKTTLKVVPIFYKKNTSLLLRFKYNNKLIALAKSIGCKWSATNRGWYIYHSSKNIRLIKNAFNDIAEIDFSEIIPVSIEKKLEDKPVKIPKEYRDLLIRRRYSDNTIRIYCSFFKEFITYYSDINPTDITEDDIRKYQDYLVKTRKVSASAQNQAINSIKFYYEKVLGREKGEYIIERPIREKKLPEVISEKELMQLLKVTDNIKHKSIIVVLYSSGIRRGELINLRIRDIDFDKKIIFVRGGKGKKDRTTILADHTALILKKYLKIYRPNYWLFEGISRKQYSPTSVVSILKMASIKAGLNKIVRPHMLRHSFATHMLEQGVDLRYIQTLLGHGSPKTTQIYTRVTSYSLAKIKSPFDTIFDKKSSKYGG